MPPTPPAAPTCPDRSCPDPSCPDPSYPDSTCPDPSCPDPTCPDPTWSSAEGTRSTTISRSGPRNFVRSREEAGSPPVSSFFLRSASPVCARPELSVPPATYPYTPSSASSRSASSGGRVTVTEAMSRKSRPGRSSPIAERYRVRNPLLAMPAVPAPGRPGGRSGDHLSRNTGSYSITQEINRASSLRGISTVQNHGMSWSRYLLFRLNSVISRFSSLSRRPASSCDPPSFSMPKARASRGAQEVLSGFMNSK